MQKSVLVILCLISSIIVQGRCMQQFDRSAFYAAMAGDNLDNVDAQLQILDKLSFKEKEAFSGALLMKKAGLVKGPPKKLSLFKEGHKKLEAVIAVDSSHAEYRFLRLMIQENAPGILNYNKERETDGEYIRKHFANLPPAAQKAVTAYSKRSKVLKPAPAHE